jgi:hypothetical protein
VAELSLLGIAGAAFGSLKGGVSILQGFQIGSALSSALFPRGAGNSEEGRIEEVRLGASSYGSPVPLAYGRARLPGQLIWLSELRESSASRRVGGKGGGSVTTFEYRADFAVALCRGPITAIRRIWANNDVIYDARDGSAETESWLPLEDAVVYLGTDDQAADSTISAAVGAGDTPAYRGTAYIVFNDFDLTRFGNVIPQINVEVETASEVTLEEVLEDLAAYAGIAASRVDFSAVASIIVRGFVAPSEGPITAAFEALEQAYRFDIVEVDGGLTAVPWGSVAVEDYDAEEFGLVGDADYVSLTAAQAAEVPRSLEVRYQAESIDFQPATQSARFGHSAEDAPSLDVAAVLSNDEAATLALIELARQHVQRLAGSTNVLPWALRHAPGDLLRLTWESGEVRTFKVSSMSLREDGGIALAMVEDDPAIYSLTATGQAPAGSSSGLVEVGDLLYEARGQLPQLADGHNNAFLPQPLVYLWAGRERTGWPGLQFGNGDGYLSQQAGFRPETVRVQSTMGETASSLAAAPAFNLWDETSTVDVQILSGGGLVSRTKLEVYNGANLCLIGSELLSFRTATLLSPGVYRLSGLLRGRKGTEAEAGSLRASGADFMMIEPLPFAGAEGYAAALSAPTYVNRLTGGTSAADTTEFRLTENGALIADIDVPWDDSAFRPYSPAHLKVTVQENGDRLITWTRRVYRQQELFDGGDSPLEYDAERYALAIGGAAAVPASGYREFGWDTNLLLLGATAGSRTPNPSTALTVASYTVPAATWAGWAAGAKKIMVAQVGQRAAVGYLMHGRPAMIETAS